MNLYQQLTREMNQGRLRAILSSGQAAVYYRLAMASKDGDWLLREDSEATEFVLALLEARGARYRLGAPLDCRWLGGGWSSHLEFREGPLRVRTDFVTRPPRMIEARLRELWGSSKDSDLPVVGLVDLARLKQTDREKDYAIIGELARLMQDPRDQLLHSRSARDLMALGTAHPQLAAELQTNRPLLAHLQEGRDRVEQLLDAERRLMMRANETRLLRYTAAATTWRERWPAVQREVQDLPLREAHRILVRRAEGVLPFDVAGGEERA